MKKYTSEPVPSAAQGLLVGTKTGVITIVVTGLIAIARGLQELLYRRGTTDEKKTIPASGGSAFAALTNGRTFQANSNEMTMVVDNGATEHFLDDELIPGSKDRMMNPTPLHVPTTITAGNMKLLATMTVIIYGTVTDPTRRRHRAHFPI